MKKLTRVQIEVLGAIASGQTLHYYKMNADQGAEWANLTGPGTFRAISFKTVAILAEAGMIKLNSCNDQPQCQHAIAELTSSGRASAAK